MGNDSIQKLRLCLDLLDLYEKPLRESLKAGAQMEDPQAIMLLRGLALGRATLKAMAAVAEADDECGVCLPTLCRPAYELAAKLLWASREPDGWQRLQAHCANEDKKWARRAMDIPSWAECAQPALDNAERVLSRTDSDGKPYRNPPTMDRILEQVEQCDIDNGLKTEGESSAAFEYAILWQMMCRNAHGHLVHISRPSETHARIGVTGAAVATCALLRAIAVVTADDLKGLEQSVDLIARQINKILRGETDLGDKYHEFCR